MQNTITYIRDEMNAIHVETFSSRKTLKKRLARFEQHCEDVDGRLDRVEQLLLKAIAVVQASAQVPQKLGRGTFVKEDIDETNTKTIANSKPEKAKPAVKEPVRYKPEVKKRKKGKSVETKEEEASDVEKPREVDSKKNKKKRKATESDQEETPAAPLKKRSKASELAKIDESDEIDDRDHVLKAKKSKNAKKAIK
jgi:hypothetical protein